MRSQWQEFRELICSSRYDPIASRERRIALLQAVLAIAIALAAGPEVFLAMEMTAVMELLGALLFLTAMGAGAKLVAWHARNFVRSVLFPMPLPFLVWPRAPIPAKALSFVFAAAHASWCLALALSCRFVGESGASIRTSG
jgi:hypothetical protein